MEPQKPTKQDGNATTIFLHHPYILCHFAKKTHAPQNPPHALLFITYSNQKNEHSINYFTTYYKLITAHFTALCIQDNPYLPHSTATKRNKHNAHSNIPWTHT